MALVALKESKVGKKLTTDFYKTNVLKERQKELEIAHQHKARLGKKTFKSSYSVLRIFGRFQIKSDLGVARYKRSIRAKIWKSRRGY